MAGRRSGGRGISGPQSALTDFLASNNISARQIRDSAAERRRAAEQANDPNQENVAEAEDEEEDETLDLDPQEESSTARKRKRSKPAQKAPAKGRKKSKKQASPDDDFEDDTFGVDMYQKSKPMPGQLENCEICSKRFTVTPYSKTGPDGGLLCTPCGKVQTAEEKAQAKKTKKPGPGRKRRELESNRLDGFVRLGAKTLQDLCIEKAARHAEDLEELGDLPEILVDRLSQIFSKRRVLDSRTLKLFLRPDIENVIIHDAANLGNEDFKHIFAVTPNVRKLVLGNAGQMKDSAFTYMIEKASGIKHFQVYGANLVTEGTWKTFFHEHGHKLETLKLQWLDCTMTDDVVETISQCCPNLKHLKLKYCRQLTPLCFESFIQMKQLTGLSLHMSETVTPNQLIPVAASLGPNLETLSLQNFVDINDTLIDSIRKNCSSLKKLRITDVDGVTDKALSQLFTTDESKASAQKPTHLPPLTFVDFSGTRDIDMNNPGGPDEANGFASSAFESLMSHSRTRLQVLHMASCRHVSHGALCGAFNPDENTYPQLRELNLSFCRNVDTSVINGVFQCCPKISKVIAFGCFKIDNDVVVPRNVALIGVPTAQDSIEKIGDGLM